MKNKAPLVVSLVSPLLALAVWSTQVSAVEMPVPPPIWTASPTPTLARPTYFPPIATPTATLVPCIADDPLPRGCRHTEPLPAKKFYLCYVATGGKE